MQEILIKASSIEQNDQFTRMKTDILQDNNEYHLFAEVENDFANFLCPELADAQVYLCLPVALRKGYNIVSETPVSEIFLHNINEILIPHLVMGDTRLKEITVSAPASDLQFHGNGVGTAISCGVDSTYTILEYLKNSNYKNLALTHVFMAPASIDLWSTKYKNLSDWTHAHQSFFTRYEAFAKDIHLPFIKLYSNYVAYICQENKLSHLRTHQYITMANVLAIKKLWKAYFFSSTVPFTIFNLTDNSTFDTDRHELLSMHILSIPGFLCFSGGAKKDRIAKTLSILDSPLAQKYLHPCFSANIKNCSKPTCKKCLTVLCIADYYNKIDCLKTMFDIQRYKTHRKIYLAYLTSFIHDRLGASIPDLYQLFCDKYPNEMKKITEEVEHKTAHSTQNSLYTLNTYHKTQVYYNITTKKLIHNKTVIDKNLAIVYASMVYKQLCLCLYVRTKHYYIKTIGQAGEVVLTVLPTLFSYDHNKDQTVAIKTPFGFLSANSNGTFNYQTWNKTWEHFYLTNSN